MLYFYIENKYNPQLAKIVNATKYTDKEIDKILSVYSKTKYFNIIKLEM